MAEQEEDQKEIHTNSNFINEDNKDKNNNLTNNNISIYLDSEINPIVDQLIEIGYNSLYSKRLVAYYQPLNIDEALNYFLKENDIIQHFFIEDRNIINDKLCFLCGEKKQNHLGYIPDNSIIIEDNNRNNILSNDILINDLILEDNNINKKLIKNTKKNTEISIKEETCGICSNKFIENDGNKLKNCGHSFCNDCWYNFLSIKIEENKLTFIKCLNYECQEKLSDEFIINLLKSNQPLIDKFKKYKLELEIINDPKKKFCPYPDCNSYAVLKDNKYVKCLNNHMFCFICLEKPHAKKPCSEMIEKSIQVFSKNHFLKKCPHCGIITEKVSGCNHITCSKCNYQWCWLCNGQYNPEHFRQGKCKGFQFFRPKNENDIELAFKGEIELNESQRQQDLSINNNNNIRTIRLRHRYIEPVIDDRFDDRSFRNDLYDNVFNGIRLLRETNFYLGVHRSKFYMLFSRILRKLMFLFIYLFFGHFFILIKIFTQNILDITNFNNNKFIAFIISLTFILIFIPNFFLQIMVNIIMFIPYVRYNKLDTFDEIKNINNFIIYSFLDIFNLDIIIRLYNKFKVELIKKFRRKIFVTTYCLIFLLYIFAYFSYNISIGTVKYILNIIIKIKYLKII